MKILKKALTMLLIMAFATSIMASLTAVIAQNNEPLFSVTIIAPGNANLLRRQWSQVFASNLQELGIDAKVVYLGWTPVYERVFTPSEDMVGKTFDEGGYDIEAVGWTPGLLPDTEATHHSLHLQDKTTTYGITNKVTLCLMSLSLQQMTPKKQISLSSGSRYTSKKFPRHK